MNDSKLLPQTVNGKKCKQLASCIIYAQPSGTQPSHRRQLLDWLHKPRRHRWLVASQCPFRWQPVPTTLLVWLRSFIEPDSFGNNVPFDNTTPIYLINLPWKLKLGLGSDLKLHYFSNFHRE